jgi:hypothetical protein
MYSIGNSEQLTRGDHPYWVLGEVLKALAVKKKNYPSI